MRDEVADGVCGGHVVRIVAVRTHQRIFILDAADYVCSAVGGRLSSEK